MHQVGHLTELYKDARSEKYKIVYEMLIELFHILLIMYIFHIFTGMRRHISHDFQQQNKSATRLAK